MRSRRIAVPAVAALTLAVLALMTGTFEAGNSVITPNGHLLTVEVEVDNYDPTLQGLVVVDQGPSGTSSETLFSTWDPVIDQNPNMTLNPYDGQPVVVWSRQIGADFELAMMRRTPAGPWAPLNILTYNQTNDIEPRAIVDDDEIGHVVWWPSGIGGYVTLQSFDVRNGQAQGPPQRPFEGSGGSGRKLNGSEPTGGSSVGGSEDPGTIGGLNTRAAAEPCPVNPAAAPCHGVVLGCGRPAAYQLSACKLLVGVYNVSTSTWGLTVTDLSGVSLTGTSVREIVQTQVDARCN